VDEVLQRAADAGEAVRLRQQALQVALAPRLWMPPDLVQRLQGAHAQTLACWMAWCERLHGGARGLCRLPLDDAAASAEAPAPVVFEA
jgi:hypothetical protein